MSAAFRPWHALARRLAPCLAMLLLPTAMASAGPPGCYFGVYETGGNAPAKSQDLTAINGFEADAGKAVAIINVFHSWATNSDTASDPFPTADLDAIRAHGSIPLFSWQPQDGAAGTTQSFTLAQIINGTYDGYITTWATAAQNWGHPFFLRFAHEMNGNWYPWSEGVNGNTAGQYVQAWRHVHDIFTRLGVANVTWVWCVNTVYTGSTDIAELYPGDNYVDWTSFDAYNRGGSKAHNFSDLSEPTHAQLLSITSAKPVMMAEDGTVEDATVPKDQWFHDTLMYYLEDKFPSIKAYCYFNVNANGYDNRIETSDTAQAAFAAGIGLSYFATNDYGSISDTPIQPLLADKQTTDTLGPFVGFAAPNLDTVTAGATTTIRVNAVDKSGIGHVDIAVPGSPVQTVQGPPYAADWAVPAAAGVAYTITATAYDTLGNASTATATVASQLAAPVITSATSAAAQAGTAFSYQITAANAPASFGAGPLPEGLQADPATGIVSGMPAATGVFPVVLTASNAAGTGTAALTLTVSDAAVVSTPTPTPAATPIPTATPKSDPTPVSSPTPAPDAVPVITSASTATAQLTRAFQYQIVASNTPTAFTVAGLPDGLALDGSSGLISGTPTLAGTYAVTLGAANDAGAATLTLTLVVAAAPLPEVSIVAMVSATTADSGVPAVFAIYRTGDLSTALKVKYKVKGTGVAGTDYQALTGTKKIKPGKGSALIQVYPRATSSGGTTKTVKLKLAPDAAYTLTASAQAKVRLLPERMP